MKKLLSLFVASVMVASVSTSAFASGLPDGQTGIDGSGTGVGIADSAITAFTVPTSGAFDFIYDPQGLTNITGAGTKLSDLGGGNIVMKNDAAAEFINKSGYDVNVEAKIALTATGLTVVTTKTGIDAVAGDATDKKALFYVLPSTTDVITTGTSNGYAPTAKGIVVPETGLDLNFALPAADYTIAESYGSYTATLIDAFVHGNAIKIGGYVNPNVDYSGITGTKLTVTFKVTKKAAPVTGDAAYESTADIISYGLLAVASATTVAVPVFVPASAAPTVAVSATTWTTGGSDITATFDLGKGSLAGTSIDNANTKFTFKMGSTEMTFTLAEMTDGSYASITGNVITIPAATLAYFDPSSTLKIVFAFKDSVGTVTKNITIQ